jgi:acyl-CoA thioester hydrolase
MEAPLKGRFMKYSHPFCVEWSNMDANLHMANVSYNAFATNARVGFLFEVGFKFDGSLPFGPVVLSDAIFYKRELHLGDKGTTQLLLLGVSPDYARWKIRHNLIKETGELAAVIDCYGGWMDLKARKLMAPQSEFVTHFMKLERCQEFEELRSLKIS